MRFGPSVLVAVVACAACSAKGPAPALSDTGGDDDDDGGASSSGGTLTGGGTSIVSADGGNTANQVGCSAEAKLVYVVDEANTLHSFNPANLEFGTVGTLNCPSASTPNSMAIDRSGVAWVNYSDGTLYKVSILDATCQATAYTPGQAGLGLKYGMAFATDSATSTAESLYIIGSNGDFVGRGLGIIDTTSLTATPIADFTNGLQGHAGELTGTGDARLFGFFDTMPNATLAQITPATAATPSPMTLSGVATGEAFAFSFWGGDFWLYTAAPGATSIVTQRNASSDNSLAQVTQEVGFIIVGAGVSTCAPITPPTIR